MIRCEFATEIGSLTLVSNGAALIGLYFPGHKPGGPPPAARPGRDAVIDAATRQIGDYFAGARTVFELPLALSGAPFQKEVWRALGAIPHGQVVTYGDLAATLGAPRAVRAVGGAVARNPISIIIPCHRVIGARGALTGYAGGLFRKQYLLGHEGALALSMPLKQKRAAQC